MTNSHTQSQTKSYTYANVRHVIDKILADLTYLLTRFPGIFTEERMSNWKNDFYNWMNDGYVHTIAIQFMRNEKCFYEIEYSLKDDGTITSDDNVGRFRGVDLAGSSTYVIVTYSSKWTESSEEEQQKFREEKLNINWGPARKTNYTNGLTKNFDKQYSSGSLGVQRSVLGS